MNGDLKQLVHGALTAFGDYRQQCEATLTQSLARPGFACELITYIFSDQAAITIPERQFGCHLLKKLVLSYWNRGDHDEEQEEQEEENVSTEALLKAGALAIHASTKNQHYVVAVNEKLQIKQLLLDGISQRLQYVSDKKLQTSLCMAIACIFERDFPDQWPQMMPLIMHMIASETPLAIAFGIRFLSFASQHFSSDQFCDVVQVVFPHLENLFQQEALGLKTQIVRIVQSALLMIGMEAHVGNTTAQALLKTHLATWMQLLLSVMTTTESSIKVYGLQIQILSTWTSFVREWPKLMSEWIPSMYQHISMVLQRLVPVYMRDIIGSEEEEELAYDSDSESGSQIGLSALMVACFEFVRGTLHAPTKKTRQFVLLTVQSLVDVMISLMQISEYQMQLWTDDPNKFVADEDDESLIYNVRHAAMDLLIEMDAVLGQKAVVEALNAAQARLHDAHASWRVHEAALLVVGCLAEPILSMTNQSIDVPAFLATLMAVMNASNQEIYLRARALWCASRLAPAMGPEILDQFLQIAISGLEPHQMVPVRMYACRAIGSLMSNAQKNSTIFPMATSTVMLDRLVQLSGLMTHETLHIALETIVVVLQAVDKVSIGKIPVVIDCFVGQWQQQLNDPLVSELIERAIRAILDRKSDNHAQILSITHERVLPVIQRMLIESSDRLTAQDDATINATVVAGSAMTLLKTLLRHSFLSTSNSKVANDTMQHMNQYVIQTVLAPLVYVLNAVQDDERVLDAGAECLKWLVMFATDALAAYQLPASSTTAAVSGIDATLHIAAKLLATQADQDDDQVHHIVCVGGLITQILLKLGAALPMTTVQSILQAIGTRLAIGVDRMPSMVQSLCLVFARLVHSHGRALLDVLQALPAPIQATGSASSLLEFVLTTWIEHQMDFYGLYCLRVTWSALLQVLEWQDPRIQAIMVTGSRIESPDDSGRRTIRTRSQSNGLRKKDQFVRVHFVTKLVVVLAQTMSQLTDDEDEWQSSNGDDDEHEDDEAFDEHANDSFASQRTTTSDSIFSPAEHFELLSDRLDAPGGAFADDPKELEEEEEEDAFEAHFDPLNELDLKIVLPQTLQQLTSNQELVHAMLPELTPADKELLAAATAAFNTS